MTPVRWLLLQVVVVIAVAAGAMMWASALMGSFDTYRSPFHGHSVAPGDPIDTPLTHHLVFVYVDGLRIDTAANAQVMPYLNELRANAASAISRSRQPSYSIPGYTTMMSGAWPEFNDGPLLNPDAEHAVTWPQDNLFRAAKRAGLKIGLADHYSSEKIIPQDTLADHVYVHGEADADDRAVTEAAVRWLKDGSYPFIVVHYDQVDDTGHRFGPRSPKWNEAAHNVDVLLRELGGALNLSRDTIFITSDHGHIDQGGHGGHEQIVRREPWVLAGAGVKPGRYPDTRMIDIAPTMAALLGAGIPALSQGRVRFDMLQTTAEQKAAIDAAYAKQQTAWLAAYNGATGEAIAMPASGPDAIQATVNKARAERAASERISRIVIALIPLVIILIAAWFARGTLLLWQVLGALVYFALFHAAYYLIEERTYSLSSVLSAADILKVGIGTAAIAFAIAGAFIAWQSGWLKRGPVEAASAAMGLALTTIALAAIPALVGYAINGPTITWTMPDFALLFFTFLTLLQIAGIAVASSVIATISALAAWRMAPKA
ncbi:MAG: hypothetical protein GC190_10695 [Alphaproteobacteria bacterium]|nr:hypothetical protein [Alphaproteobacteria bacterium]